MPYFCKTSAVAIFASLIILLGACGSNSTSLTAQSIANKYHTTRFDDATFTATFHQTGGTSGAIDGTGTGRYVNNPYRLYLNLDAHILNLSVNIQQISTDQYDYQKTSLDTKWTRTASVPSSSSFSLKDLSDAKLLGTEKILGFTAYHLLKTQQTSVGKNTGDFWLRTSDYLPVKLVTTEVEDKDNNTLSTTTTLEFQTWNTGVKVTLPPDGDINS